MNCQGEFMSCISNEHNSLKQMMRYIPSLCFLIACAALPASAKENGSFSSKASSKDIPVSVVASKPAPDKKEDNRLAEVTLTPDLSRAAAAALIANGQCSSAPQKRPVAETQRTVAETLPAGSKFRSSFGMAEISTRGTDLSASPITRLARVTAYWAAEGDYYTGRRMSATGVRLHDGLCAVDPSIIPYGSVVEIAGFGQFLAVDTGSAVISRAAAREGGRTSAERGAIVVDIFFESRREGENFAAAAAKYSSISWWTPMATNTMAKVARSLFTEEDWLKIESKQL
jgi:3D (Asp-Asp-Asp) domain-containing protein